MAANEDRRQYHHLHDALRDNGIPAENWPLIERYTRQIGISRYHRTSGYIRADRADGSGSLKIGWGWGLGFTSRDEAIVAAGRDQEVWQWMDGGRPSGIWGVTHPVHGAVATGEKTPAKPVEKVTGICPTCFTRLPNTGTCDYCA